MNIIQASPHLTSPHDVGEIHPMTVKHVDELHPRFLVRCGDMGSKSDSRTAAPIRPLPFHWMSLWSKLQGVLSMISGDWWWLHGRGRSLMLRCSNWKPDCMHASTSLVCLAEIVGEFRCHFIYILRSWRGLWSEYRSRSSFSIPSPCSLMLWSGENHLFLLLAWNLVSALVALLCRWRGLCSPLITRKFKR